MKCLLFLLFALIYCTFTSSNAQEKENRKYHEYIPRLVRPTNHDPNFNKITEKSFYQLKNGWQAIIDSTWGTGLPLSNKLDIFDTYTAALSNEFDGILSLGLNWTSWDSLILNYRNQIDTSTSRGSFSAIISYLANSLRDIHTWALDDTIWTMPLNPGVPILITSGLVTCEHFGAVVTVSNDSSVLILRTVPNHPLGLQPGDIILGYDGIPYNQLISELMAAKLPLLIGGCGGGASSAGYDALLLGAGMNWHLFNTIDILQYSSGNTLHLSTAPMINLNVSPMLNNEQMEMPGIPFPDFFNNIEHVSYGIINNTNIGYIYLFSEYVEGTADQQFYHAVSALQNTNGLIIDMRWNNGGWAFFDQAFNILFNESPLTIEDAYRCSFSTLDLCLYGNAPTFQVQGSQPSIYDHPIAVLLGPTCVSMGDITAYRLGYHPMVKFFGKPTAASLGDNYGINNYPNWILHFSISDMFHVNQPGVYLNRREFPIDFPVWHNKDDAANGIDAVVEAAVSWMNKMIHAYEVKSSPIFVTPQIDTITINANVANPDNHNILAAVIISTLDSVFVDSITMFDDGNHNDSLAGDGLYGCLLNPVSSEDVYTVGVSVTDLDSIHYHKLPKASRFTTTGPIVFDSYTLTPSFGTSYRLYLNLRNDGILTTAKNVTAYISTTDSAVTSIDNNNRSFGDIETGQTITSIGDYRIYTANLQAIDTLKFAIEIFSDGYEFWQDTSDVIVGFSEKASNIPKIFSLSKNYPNPFNPRTTIEFSIPKSEFVTLKIYNLLGQEVTMLVSEKLSAGNYKYNWDASGFASGVYYYKIETTTYSQTKKLLLIK